VTPTVLGPYHFAARTFRLHARCGCAIYAFLGRGLAPAQTSLSVASKIVASANGFLSSLDEGQRSKVLFDFNDAAQRKNWSNLPTTMAPRAGLKMGDLSGPQRKAAMGLLAAMLSKRGYEKVLAIVEGIVEGDEALRVASGVWR
jgi:hypothetical protein